MNAHACGDESRLRAGVSATDDDYLRSKIHDGDSIANPRRAEGPADGIRTGSWARSALRPRLPRCNANCRNCEACPYAISGFIDNSRQLANIMLCDIVLRSMSFPSFKTWGFTTSPKKREKDVLNVDGFIYQLSTSGKYHIGADAHGLFFHFLPSGGRHAPERGMRFALNWIFGPAHVDIVGDSVTIGRPAT